ncbi:MAG: exodeoxyribonuclease VII large subunit [Sandaracinus sp.]|nr:exodeoxyribonuclease VII large subunit [Sandaracinus sp.]
MSDERRRPWGQRPAENRGPKVFRVAEVNRAARERLESTFSDFWVEGEVSQAKPSRTGHVYFTLSDEREVAQLPCVIFANDLARAKAPLRDGVRLKVRGNLSLYEPRGSFQMQVRVLLPAGEGDLAQRREQVRQRLDADGLFAAERKRALPRLPRTIGVVTSARGAAVEDVIRVAHGRSPVRLVVADCQVQGDGAPLSIVQALRSIQRLTELDLVILCRGGGSAEDLWAFDHEQVCRAVAECRVPIVCGVGHESDVSLAELVADVRASTPSNAAERAVPEREVLQAEVRGLERRLSAALEAQVGRARLRHERVLRRLGAARSRIHDARADLERLDRRLEDAMRARLRRERESLADRERRVRAHDPRVALARDRRQVVALEERLRTSMRGRLADERARLGQARTRLLGSTDAPLARSRGRLGALAARLDALSPLRVLERGYAITFGPDGRALRRADAVKVGDAVRTRLHRGSIVARVESVESPEEE